MSVWKSMRRRGLSAAWALAILIVLAGAKRGRSQEMLRWAFEPGQSLRYEFSQTSKLTIRGGERPEERTIRLTAVLAWDVKAVEAGTATIAQTVERVRAEVKAGSQSVVYDSSKNQAEGPNASALAELYGAVMSEPATLKIDARGRIIEAHVPEKVTEALRGSPFQSQADGGSLMSERGLKNMLGQVLPPLPEAATAQGGTWDGMLEIASGPLQISLATKYTLEAVEDPNARIVAAIETAIQPQPGVPLKVTVKSQKGQGVFHFDTRAGRLADAEVMQTFDLGIEVADQSFGQLLEMTLTLKPLGEGT